VLYDEHPNGGSLKSQSWHDSDPARGQVNAFDLVRAHRFGHLDSVEDKARPVTERPSYAAMCKFALTLPEVHRQVVDSEFEDLGDPPPDFGPLTAPEKLQATPAATGEALAKRICDVMRTPTTPRWLIRDYLERGVIALLVGKRGSYKSFIGLDWTARIAKDLPNTPEDDGLTRAVLVVSAEGGDYDRRSKAWWKTFGDGRSIDNVPWYVIEKRMNLNHKDGILTIHAECARLKIRPVLCVLDTFSKLATVDENDNSAVKNFIGLLDNGIKRYYDATVLLVAHTGHGDQTRARGASALGADTDSEYIVERDERAGLVRLTRERFKSSPELGPVVYKPEVVDLEYQDHDGRQVTSLVMRESETPTADLGAGRQPSGANQKKVFAVLHEMCAAGATVSVSAVVQKVVDTMIEPDDGKRDRRRDIIGRALNQLVDGGFCYLSAGGKKVSLSRVVSVDDEFEEQEHLK
jgi:hypothetical protein